MEIEKNLMLTEIDQTVDVDGKPVFFSLAFYNSNGEYRELSKCSKNWKKTKVQAPKSTHANKLQDLYSIKEKGLLLIYDHDQERHISIHIQLIVKYNGYRVKH